MLGTDQLEFFEAQKRERELQALRGTLVREALRLGPRRPPLRARVGRLLVRAGGRLEGKHADPALRELLYHC